MKTIYFGDEAREKLKKGVDLIANAVKVTLGPRGRNFIYAYHYGYPVCTKDGVTVAKNVEATDPTEQLGLLLVRQVAQKTADDAGDGTTTATLLAQEIFTEGLKVIKSGGNPILVKRGMDKAVEEVIAYIDKVKTPVINDDDIIKVASLSGNNDRAIGELVNDAFKKVGKDGVITLEDNIHPTTVMEMVEGMQLNEGLFSPYFVTDTVKMDGVFKDPLIVIVDEEIHNVEQIKNILEAGLKTTRPVVLIVNQLSANVLQLLVQSKMKNNAALMVVKSPYFGAQRSEQLIDIAIATGGKVIGPGTGLRMKEATVEDLGSCETFRATKSYSTIVNGKGKKEDVESRIALLKKMIDESESDYEIQKFQERLSKLTTGVAVVKVGAPTEVEQKDKKMRMEDALLATRAAIEDGIVAGGGLTLLKASYIIKEIGDEEELIGRRIIKRALRAPIKQIAFNAGLDGSEIIAGIPQDSQDFGYDFLNNKYGDLMELGVIDPAKVVKATIVNAASVAGLLLSTQVSCSEEEEVQVTRTPKGRP